MSLLESHPELLVFRDLRAWWDLRATVDAVPLEAQAVEAAFAAWAASDREWGDDPGAAAHEALAQDISSALRNGVHDAFAGRAAVREAAAPEVVRGGLRRVDESASEYLRDGDRDALAAAGETLDELLRSSAFADADALLKLAVYSDGAQLFEALLRASQDDEMLRRVIACCEMTLQFRRRLDQHPPVVLLNLDPRLQSMAGLLGKRLGTRYARRGDPKDLMRAVQMAEWALGLTATSAPDYPLRLEERAVALGYRRDEASIAIANDSMRQAAELEPVFSPVRAHFRLQHGNGLVELHRRTRRGDLLDEAIAVLRQAQGEARPELQPTLAHRLGAALRLRYDRDRDPETLDEASDLIRQAVQAASGPWEPATSVSRSFTSRPSGSPSGMPRAEIRSTSTGPSAPSSSPFSGPGRWRPDRGSGSPASSTRCSPAEPTRPTRSPASRPRSGRCTTRRRQTSISRPPFGCSGSRPRPSERRRGERPY